MRTLLRYPGSKQRIAPWIISHMPVHHSYLEPYAGGITVLLNKEPSRIETINDLDNDVVNLFRVIQNSGTREQEAYFGLYEAVQRYEDTAGVLFMSYAGFWIRQAFTRYLENNDRSIRLPAAMQGKLLLYKKLISAYEMQLGRKPADYELCRHMRVNSKILLEIKKACQTDNIQSLDECVPGADEVLLEECIPDPDIDIENNVIDNMIERGKRTELWQIVKDNTSPEENTVITARYRKGLSMEAAGRLIGISRDTARNIEAKTLRKLRRSKITRLLGEKFEVNYARGYRGSFSRFRDTGNSIVEDIVIKNLAIKENKMD